MAVLVRVFCVLLLMLPAAAQADEASAFEVFKQAYIGAANSGDASLLEVLEYPDPLAKDAKYDAFKKWQLKKDMTRKLPLSSHFRIEAAEGEGMFKPMGFLYPVAPTHKMQVDYILSEVSSGTVVREMYYDAKADKFLIVNPLPSDALLATMQPQQGDAGEREDEIEE